MATFRSIHIRNFRGFQDFQIKDLRKFNLFVGPNEVGKTNILEALYALSCHGAIGSLISDPLRRCALRRNRKEEQIHQASLFHNMQTSRPIELSGELDSSGKTIRLDAATKMLPPDGMTPYKAESEAAEKQRPFYDGCPSFNQMQTEWKLTSSHGRHLVSGSSKTKITDKGIECKETSGNMDDTHVRAIVCTQQDAAYAVDELQSNDKMESVVTTLRLIEPSLKSIYLDRNNLPMVRLEGVEQPMPIHSMGDGFRAILSVLEVVDPTQQDVVLVDELAANIYFAAMPVFLRALFSFFRDKSIQIFATTHSKDLLIALKQILGEEEALREDVVCFSLSHDKHGNVQAYPYTYEAIDHCIEHDIEFR